MPCEEEGLALEKSLPPCLGIFPTILTGAWGLLCSLDYGLGMHSLHLLGMLIYKRGFHV